MHEGGAYERRRGGAAAWLGPAAVLAPVHESKQAARMMSEDVEALRGGLDRRLSGAGPVHQSKQQAARMSEHVEMRRVA